MSVALDSKPVQTLRKADSTRKRKKDVGKNEGLRKRRGKAKHKIGQDPWLQSRKKMGKLRDARRRNRRAKFVSSGLHNPDEAAAANTEEPVSDAAPTTPLITPVRKPREAIAKINVLDLPCAAKTPPCPSPPAQAEAPTLEPVVEDIAETQLSPESIIEGPLVEDPGDFTPQYVNAKSGSSLGRRHTAVNQRKKLRRAKRGPATRAKWAASHSLRSKDWKNRRRAAKWAKAALHTLGGSVEQGGLVESKTPKNDSEGVRGRWVAVPQMTKGDCSERPNEEPATREHVDGAAPAAEPVEQSNSFDALSRRARRYRGRRNPRWRRNWQSKKQAKAAKRAAEGPSDAAEPGTNPEPKQAAEPKPRRQRRMRWRRKKAAKAAAQEQPAPGPKAENNAPAKAPATQQADAKATEQPSAAAASPAVLRRRERRRRQKLRKRGKTVEAGADGSGAPTAKGQPAKGRRNRQRGRRQQAKDSMVWQAKHAKKVAKKATPTEYRPGPTAVDL